MSLRVLRRVRIFLLDEIPTAWDCAGSRACHISGGHQWGSSYPDESMGCRMRDCKRCGCSETVIPDPFAAEATPYVLRRIGGRR